MADRIENSRTREPQHETDAFMRGVIHYLDSPTDYREFLPHAGSSRSVQENELVILDDLPRRVQTRLRNFTLVAILFGIILLVLLRI